MEKQGICCECQSPVPVRLDEQSIFDEILSEDYPILGEDFYGSNYITEPHDFFGRPCSGSGMTPQAVFREVTNEHR